MTAITKGRVYIIWKDGEAVALIRATSAAQAIRFHTQSMFEITVCDTDHAISLGKRLDVVDATSADNLELALGDPVSNSGDATSSSSATPRSSKRGRRASNSESQTEAASEV